MRYTLRQLEVFLAIAQHDNVSQAARELSLSQSAASGALKDLESQFDIQLFDRIGKRLQLNEMGWSLRPKVQALLEQAHLLQLSLQRDESPGHLQVGATLTIGNYLAVPLIAALRARYPNADVGLTVANTEAIVNGVTRFELDVGMIEGEVSHPELDIMHWRNDELAVFAAPGHPLAHKKAISDSQLLQQRWVIREQGSGTRQIFDRAMSGLLGQLNVSLELQHTEAIKRAVEAGLGCGCLSRISLADAFKRGTLIELAVPQRNFRRALSIVVHKQKFRSAGLQQWLALCEESRQQETQHA